MATRKNENCVRFTTSDHRTITLNDGDIYGRDRNAMSQRISRELFSIKSITTSQIIINNNNTNQKVAICELQLLKKYIRINDTEYYNEKNAIPIYDGDIVNLVETKYENEQFWLKLSINNNYYNSNKNRKRKRSEHILFTDQRQSPSKKRKISQNNNNNNNNDDYASFTKKPKKSLKDLEKTWNIHQINNTKEMDIDHIDEDDDYDINNNELLHNTLVSTCPMDIIDNDNDEYKDLTVDDNDNDNINDNDATIYSDGVWCILVPTNDKNASVLISCDRFTIGRDASNDLIFENLNVSGRHSCIIHNKIRQKILLQDSSTNGTFINSIKLKHQERQLSNGDCISFADVEEFYYFRISAYFDYDECFGNNENENENENDEFNVILKKINSKYYLTMNGKEMVYDEEIYKKKCLSKCIADVVDIPIHISDAIVDYYGNNIMDIIAYNIGSQRPKKVINKPPLFRSFAMYGSPKADINNYWLED